MNCGAPLPGDDDGPRQRYSDATIDEMQRRQVKAGMPPFSPEVIAKAQQCEPLFDDYSDEDEALSPWMAAAWVLTLIGLVGGLTFWAAGCG